MPYCGGGITHEKQDYVEMKLDPSGFCSIHYTVKVCTSAGCMDKPFSEYIGLSSFYASVTSTRRLHLSVCCLSVLMITSKLMNRSL